MEETMSRKTNSRRDFIKATAAGAAGIAISSRASSYARILGANDRVRVAFVGPGDRSRDALMPAFFSLAGELNFEPVAVCDIWNKRRDEGADFIAALADKKKVPIGGEQLAKARNWTSHSHPIMWAVSAQHWRLRAMIPIPTHSRSP